MIEILKRLILCIVCIGFSYSNAQESRHLYEDTLTDNEKNILNEVFIDHRGDKDFTQMKIAFFSSPGGTIQQFHEHYFKYLNLNDLSSSNPIGNLIFFNEKESEKHGYDIAIVYKSKNIKPRLNKKLIKTKKDYLKLNRTDKKE